MTNRHIKKKLKLWSPIGLSSNLLSRGREAHQSSRSRRVWGKGKSRKAAGPAGEDGWTPYPPHGTGRWWEPHASSWRTSPAGEQPEAFHKFSGGVQFDDNYDFFLSNTSRNMLQCYMYIFHSSESLHFLNCKYIAKHPRMCTYRENSSTNGIEKQSLNIIRCHFFSKHWCGVTVESLSVVYVEPPQNARPTCKSSYPRKCCFFFFFLKADKL